VLPAQPSVLSLRSQDDAGNSFQSYLTRYGVTNSYKQSGSNNPLYL